MQDPAALEIFDSPRREPRGLMIFVSGAIAGALYAFVNLAAVI